jgi:hypothetical protein
VCSREEFYSYLKSVFSIEPKPADDQDIVRQLSADVRARVPGSEVKLLTAVAVGLAFIGEGSSISPGELVSAFWDAVYNDASDFIQFRGDIRTQIRNLLRSEASRKTREAAFFEFFCDKKAFPEENLPSWLWQLNLTEQELRIWIGHSIFNDSDREIGEAIGVSARMAKSLRYELFAKLEKKLRQMFR